MLNIVHAHVNDMSDEVTLEVEYMGDDSRLSDYEEFKTDVTGQILRYKILVKDQKIFTVLYNEGFGSISEIPFEERRLQKDELYKIPSHLSNSVGIQDDIFCKLDHIPICMVASKDKKKLQSLEAGLVRNSSKMNGFCKDRHFERLPGFVDISAVTIFERSHDLKISMVLLPDPQPLAVPVC